MKNTNFLTQNLVICGGLVLALLLGSPISTMSNLDFTFPKSVYAQDTTSDYPVIYIAAFPLVKAAKQTELSEISAAGTSKYLRKS